MQGVLRLSLILLILAVFNSSLYARDRIQIVGSSTVYPFSTVVAERYGKKYNFKTPIVESTGTGGGMKLFCSGVGERYPDITNASRAIKESEIKLCKENGINEIVEVIIGNDGIAFANSKKGKVYNFTKAQLWKAMAAKGPKPTMWNEISPELPAAKITILTPPPTSGTRDAWNSLVMKKGCDEKLKASNAKDCELMREDGAVVEVGENDNLIVKKLESNPNAYGIFGFSYLDNNRDQIQAATINGVQISLENIQSYQYPISRPLYFYLKKSHVGVIPGIKEFMKEFTSLAAMGDEGYLSDLGLVPLDEKRQKTVRAMAKSLKPMSVKK